MTNRIPAHTSSDIPDCIGRWSPFVQACGECVHTDRCRKATGEGTGIRILAKPRHAAERTTSRPDIAIDTLTSLGISPLLWPTLHSVASRFGLEPSYRKSSRYRVAFLDKDRRKVLIVLRMDSRQVHVIGRRLHVATAIQHGWTLGTEERGRVSLTYQRMNPTYENFFTSLRGLLTVSSVQRTFTP
jgi:hypothetical protein